MALFGKVALVTGSGKRLGHAIAIALAEGGADIVLHGHRSSLEEAAQEVKKRGRQALILQADLSSGIEVQRLAREALRLAGRVDILVNNAATFIHSPISTVTRDSWERLLGLNLTTPAILSLILGRAMYKRGEGTIIHIGDWSGMRPVPGYVPYCLTKGGLHILMQLLAKTFAPLVQVNEIAPGPVLPPLSYGEDRRRVLAHQTPLQRLGDPNDVTRIIRFLAEKGKGITGATYFVDGGWFAQAPSSNTSL